MSLIDLSEWLAVAATVMGIISIIVGLRERAARPHGIPPAKSPAMRRQWCKFSLQINPPVGAGCLVTSE